MAVAAPNSDDRVACCTINTPARTGQNGKVPTNFKLWSNHPSWFKLFSRADLTMTSSLEKTACRNSIWFRTYDFLKSDDLGSRRVHILLLLLLLFFPTLWVGSVPPIFKCLKILQTQPKLVHTFFRVFPRGIFLVFSKIRKIRFFTNFQTLTFLR